MVRSRQVWTEWFSMTEAKKWTHSKIAKFRSFIPVSSSVRKALTVQLWLTWNTLCRPGPPQTDLPASASECWDQRCVRPAPALTALSFICNTPLWSQERRDKHWTRWQQLKGHQLPRVLCQLCQLCLWAPSLSCYFVSCSANPTVFPVEKKISIENQQCQVCICKVSIS